MALRRKHAVRLREQQSQVQWGRCGAGCATASKAPLPVRTLLSVLLLRRATCCAVQSRSARGPRVRPGALLLSSGLLCCFTALCYCSVTAPMCWSGRLTFLRARGACQRDGGEAKAIRAEPSHQESLLLTA